MAADSRTGLLLGLVAVACWSFGASLVFFGAREAGTWPLVAIGSITGGVVQLASWRLGRGGWKGAVRLPWRLWAVPMVCFVAYGLAWPCALTTANATQVLGVSLINYLWPILTVVFSAWWVPGVRLTGRTILGLALAAAGLACANYNTILEVIAAGPSPNDTPLERWRPYLLALVAAVTWAVYSAVLSRWRAWARDYATSPLGFLIIGLAGAVALAVRGAPIHLTPRGGLLVLLYALGPQAAGYLCWESALSRARVQSLSTLAAAIPVLSTAWLCLFLHHAPGWELVVAAVLVSGGVVLNLRE